MTGRTLAEVPTAAVSAVGDRLTIEAVTAAMRDALCGPANLGEPAVIWSDRGSQLILHVGKLQLRLQDSAVVVAVDTESAEFGVAPLIVRFVFGGAGDPASLVAATDETALGHPGVAARWGQLFRDVIWAAIVRLAASRADAVGLQPAAITVRPDHLHLVAEARAPIQELALAHVQARAAAARGPRPGPADHSPAPRPGEEPEQESEPGPAVS
jgi:hypothetical protein